MKLALLVTEEMKPIPESIKVIENWSHVGIVVGEMKDYISGDHMCVEGSEQDIANWLRPFDGVWRQKPGTSPMFQQFEVVHVGDDHDPSQV